MPRRETKSEHVRWIDLVQPSEADIVALGQEFGFHPLDLEDCRKRGQRQKVERYHDYLFMVLLVPVYNRASRMMETGEVDFFVGHGYVVTVQDRRLAPLNVLFESVQQNRSAGQPFAGSAPHLLREMIDRTVVSLYPMLDHISVDIRTAEREIFAGHEKHMVEEVAMLRRNITDFRRTVQSHKNTVKRLVEFLHLNGLTKHDDRPEFEQTIDRTKEIWDLLESYRESIDTIHDTNASLISYKLNEIMRAFTVMSVMIFFMTLVATVFAANKAGTPFLNGPSAFWVFLLIVGISGFAARYFFKQRRLLE